MTLPVDLQEARIGIKPLFEGKDLDENQTASFEVVLARRQGQARCRTQASSGSSCALDTNWQWYRRDGQWNYEPVTLTRKVADGTIDCDRRRRPRQDRSPRDLRPLSARGAAAQMQTAPPPASPSTRAGTRRPANPTAPRFSTSRSTTRATSRAIPPSCASRPSKAARRLSPCCRAACCPCRRSTSPTAAARSSVAVGNDWGAGAYVTAMLYRPMDESLKRMPSRAIGVQWLQLDQSAHTLKVALDTPEKIKSDTTLTVPVKIARPRGRRGGARHARRRRPRHPQPDALPGAGAGRLVLRPAAHGARDPRLLRPPDRRHARRARHAALGRRRQAPACRATRRWRRRSRCSPASCKVDADGTAKVDFDMPELQRHRARDGGRLERRQARAMRRATSSCAMRWRSRPPRPRFLTLGDEARLDVAVHNVEGPAAAYTLDGGQRHHDRRHTPRSI